MAGRGPAEDQTSEREPHNEAGTRRRWWRRVLWGLAGGLLLALGIEVYHVFLGRNLHEVLAGRVYRCAQLSGAGLEQVIRAHGIRTVVNLRGSSPPLPWYLEECRATHHLNVCQEDLCLSANRLPPVQEMRRLVEVLDRTEYPILLHCRRGADRTGLAATVVLLLQTDTSLGEAWHQLGLRYGHVPVGQPAILAQFFELYAEWLARVGRTHSRATFRRWIEHDYCAGACRCGVEPLDVPTLVRPGEPAVLRVRFRNTGVRPWRLRPGSNAGIHAGLLVSNREDQFVGTRGRACSTPRCPRARALI